jgi:hypothetical protein
LLAASWLSPGGFFIASWSLVVAQIPVWLFGYHVTTITAQALSVNSSGVLSNSGSAETLVGVVDELSYNGRAVTERINPLTAKVENEVVVEMNEFITVAEILAPDDSSVSAGAYSVLPKIWALGGTDAAGAVQYIAFTVTRGGNSYSFTGVCQEYSESIRHGKCVGRLMIQKVDIGPADQNPTYTA